MIRGLWTAASGMTSQQLNVDTIANNLANVNTVGYKKETTNFKSLLYQTMAAPNVDNVQQPTTMQVGHGVRALPNSRNYSMGILQETGNNTDMAIEGKGFFTVQKGDQMTYTRDGSFRISLTEDGAYALVTSDGNTVLSVEDEPILIGTEIPVDKVVIGKDGSIYYIDEETNMRMEIAQLKIVQFANVEGLEAIGSNLFIQTAASGEPLIEGEEDGLIRSSIRTGYLEGSNVQVAEEMVKLIVAQRAYELNSTSIKTVDTMLQQANDLKRS
ncbi:flagellar hook-basal body protein [Cellulosilyticum sp. I15G10I2]|uniref:flagellar hook-basal body protein n=1 Tax=Cellulosilyticum sp. I15G10I2 TaxID=1892843 RepID=UPI00085BB1B2|nr:flagellar hook-basal body protein [Cellulosilyticum sp. I15G10I2]